MQEIPCCTVSKMKRRNEKPDTYVLRHSVSKYVAGSYLLFAHEKDVTDTRVQYCIQYLYTVQYTYGTSLYTVQT
jgi:hypothetical protein